MIPVDAPVQVNLVGKLFGQMTVSTFFYFLQLVSGALTEADEETLIADWDAGPASSIIDALSQDWKGDRIEVRDPRATPVYGPSDRPTSAVGVLAESACPPSVAQVITRKTGMPGRSRRGRVFLPAVPTSANEEGELSGMHLLILQGVADDMVTSVALTGPNSGLVLKPMVWSRTLQFGTEITACTARSVLRSQRRREIGVGK